MNRLRFSTRLPVAAEAAYAWHARPGAFERMVPPWQTVSGLQADGPLQTGSRLSFQLGQGPLAMTWVACHEACEPGAGFTDVQERGPFSAWRHEHRFEALDEASCVLHDAIAYTLPVSPLSDLVAGAAVAGELARVFAFRHARLAMDLRRHARFAAAPRLRVLVTGASGLVGQALVPFLTAGGHEVVRLVRGHAGPGAIAWDPDRGVLDANALEGFDAVVHLAGESIAGGRWTAERKRRILESRERGTALLAGVLARLERKPAVLVSASAIGFYGDRGDEPLDEDAEAGEGFLPEVCRRWEAATAPAAEAGIRVVHLRTGIVLAAAGGALGTMLPAFRLGLGGPVGSGRQAMSWIALEDLVGAIQFALHEPGLAGPVNATAPCPETNAAFTRALGQALGRPAVMPLPALAVRALLGELGEALLLEGARVLPTRLLDAGFEFELPLLRDALAHELGLGAPAAPEPAPPEPGPGTPARPAPAQHRAATAPPRSPAAPPPMPVVPR